jgi:hypothetical protein
MSNPGAQHSTCDRRRTNIMAHPVVLGLFKDTGAALDAANGVHRLGVTRDRLSVIARTHEDEGDLAERVGASPGSEIEDSRAAARLGELGAQLLAAIAMVLPGIGPIVSAGPLAADLGETAGHLAGGVAHTLERVGVPAEQAVRWQVQVKYGAVLLAVHLAGQDAGAVRRVFEEAGASETVTAEWRRAS